MGLAETGARGRLIVALDMATLGEARALIERLDRAASFYKIGLELALSGGLDLARELSRAGKRVFLDMKLLDIANTVERATRRAADTGATFLTVHAQDAKTLSAAVAGRAGTGLKVLGVTVLTNLDGDDLRQQGIGDPPHALVARRAAMAREVGLDGVVASGQEAERVRAIVGPDLAIVTPGIRLPGDGAADQARSSTPEAAIAAGADYLVIGRPITRARDPLAATEAFVRAIKAGLAMRASGA